MRDGNTVAMDVGTIALLRGGVLACVLGAALAGPVQAQKEGGSGIAGEPARWTGWGQLDTAYAWREPSRYANARAMGELAGRGAWENGAKWKLSGRAYYDAAYANSTHYPPGVRDDQQYEAWLHEAYVDFGAGDWEFRLGKQNIVWGEMVGLFFADVVSAKDLRSFILPEFDMVRIPQWAARAEWYSGDTHMEFIWLPTPEVNRIGEPGAEFYPWPLPYDGFGYEIKGEERPERKLSTSGYGLRVSTLVGGWDMAGFVYRAPDTQASFYRSIVDGPIPTVTYQPRYDQVTRAGATLAKDFDGIVAKAELVYTHGRTFSMTTLDASDGLVGLDIVDWVIGVDATPWDGGRVNAQFFQRAFLDYDVRIGLDRLENGASLLVSHMIREGLDAEFLGITGLNRTDYLLRAMLTWKVGRNTRVRGGVDVFGGDQYGLFGQYGNSDRVWAEYRYSY